MSVSSEWSDHEDLLSGREVQSLVPISDVKNSSKDLMDHSSLHRHKSSFSRTISKISRMVTENIDGQSEVYDVDGMLELDKKKEYPPLIDMESYTVTFDGANDPMNPNNWSLGKKIITTMVVSLYSFCNSMSTSIYSQSDESLMEIFHVGKETAILATSLYVFGYASGPVIWAPLSELYGRKRVFIPSCLGFSCFSFAVATAENLQTIMICRFFSGFCGASAMVLSSATIGDVFSSKFRGRAMVPFGFTVCVGPLIGPIIGSFTVKNEKLGWRWNAYWSGLLGAINLIMIIFILEETYHPVVLTNKAILIRKKTKNWAFHSNQEILDVSFSQLCVKYLVRPIQMLCMEPVLLSIALYGGFVYGLVFMLLDAMPLVYSGNYNFIQGVDTLPYISVMMGVVLGCVVLLLADVRYRRIRACTDGKSPLPEEKLPAMMVGGVCITIGLFWFFWTGNYPNTIHWMVPTVGAGIMGTGIITIIQGCINYIIELYGTNYAASGIAGLTIMRSILGGAFPLFAEPMFNSLHLNWSGTLIGCFSVLLIPVPFLLYFYGEHIRKYSRFLKSQSTG